MGISGLTTFVAKTHPGLGCDVPLRPASGGGRQPSDAVSTGRSSDSPTGCMPLGCPPRLVLDGNGLVYLVAQSLNYALGSHHARLERLLVDCAHALALAGTKADASPAAAPAARLDLTFVFDGLLPEYKVAERRRRDMSRIERIQAVAGAVGLGAAGDHIDVQAAVMVMPPTVVFVAIRALRSAGFTVVVAEEEADVFAARLARETGAAVVSKDSDFYVHRIPMFINLESVFPVTPASLAGAQPQTDDAAPLSADAVAAAAASPSATAISAFTAALAARLALTPSLRGCSREHLAQALSIRAEHVPLIAVLAGNDQDTDPDIVKLLRSHKLDVYRKKWAGILSLLRPLAAVPLPVAVSSLCKRMTSDSALQSKLADAFEAAIAHYDGTGNVPQDAIAWTEASGSDSVPVERLRRMVADGTVSFKLLEAAVMRTVWCTPFLEDDLRPESAWVLSRPLRQRAFGVLGCASSVGSPGGRREITEHVRQGLSMAAHAMEPSPLGPCGVDLDAVVAGAEWSRLFALIVEQAEAPSFAASGIEDEQHCLGPLASSEPSTDGDAYMQSGCWLLVLALRFVIRVRHGQGAAVGNHELNAWACAGVLALHQSQALCGRFGDPSTAPVVDIAAGIPGNITRTSLHDFAQLEATLFSMLLLFQAGLVRNGGRVEVIMDYTPRPRTKKAAKKRGR
nr:hypothetical protein HK105_000207 [Polyrhizophydium stewartii]